MFLTMPFALPATRTHHARTGNIQVLENCPNVTSLNFQCCFKIEGEHAARRMKFPELLSAHQSAPFVGIFSRLPSLRNLCFLYNEHDEQATSRLSRAARN